MARPHDAGVECTTAGSGFSAGGRAMQFSRPSDRNRRGIAKPRKLASLAYLLAFFSGSGSQSFAPCLNGVSVFLVST